MKKASVFFFLLFLGITLNSLAQTTPKDFYTVKWEISLAGTPNGDIKFITNLTRKDGKLTGELVNANDANATRPITKVEEDGDKLAIFFDSTQAGEISINLAKVDNDNLKGNLMDMFEAKATRVKN